MRLRHLLWTAILLGCSTVPTPEVAQTTPRAPRPDSIVLMRTPCFGPCPIYRLRLGSTGQVTFDDGRAIRDSVPPSVMDSLVAHARALGLRSLPDTIDRGSPHCRDYATDHPGIRLSFYGVEPRHMHYYTGCYTGGGVHAGSGAMQAVKRFAARMDTLAGATRWIRPSWRR